MSTCKTLVRICNKPSRPSLLPLTQSRHESTTRRHKKLQYIPEAPSFTPSHKAPTVTFNPPSSAPNVYHTPLKFLPRVDDKRKQLYVNALHYSRQPHLRSKESPVASPGTQLQVPSYPPSKPTAALPPALRTPYTKKYHLTDAEIGEIRTLRLQDPKTWTRVKLAEKFGCSQFFVGLVVKAEERAREVEAVHQRSRDRWGARRRMAREDRGRRREAWGRDA